MVTSSLIEPKDVDAERNVVLEEIAMNEDDPSDSVHEAFTTQLFGDTPSAADPRHRRVDQRDHQGSGLRALPRQVHPTAHRGVGRGEPGPRRRGRGHPGGVRPGPVGLRRRWARGARLRDAGGLWDGYARRPGQA